MSAPIHHSTIQRAMERVQVVPKPIDAQRLAAFAHRTEKIVMLSLLRCSGILGTACLVAQMLKWVAL